jgi:hypothetical protein
VVLFLLVDAGSLLFGRSRFRFYHKNEHVHFYDRIKNRWCQGKSNEKSAFHSATGNCQAAKKGGGATSRVLCYQGNRLDSGNRAAHNPEEQNL